MRQHAPVIIHVIDEFKIGGAQTHLVTMLKAAQLIYPGVTHVAVSLYGDGPIREKLEGVGVKTIILQRRSKDVIRVSLSILIQLCGLMRKYRPQLVEAHLTWSRVLGILAASLCGVPRRIGFEHGDIYLTSMPWRAINFLWQFITDDFIVCSNALQEWVRKTHHIAAKRINVMYNAIDTTKINSYTTAPAFAKSEFGWADSTVIFCAVGTLGSGVNKRVDVVIRAIAKARETESNIALIICGDGDQRLQLELLVKELCMEKYVRFFGMVADIPAVLAGCGAFCHAAPFEPFGIVAIEAMAMGLPIIVPDSGGIKEVVQVANSGLVYKSLDADDLAEKIKYIVQNRIVAKEMGESARIAACEKFNIDIYITKLFSSYGFRTGK